MDNHMLKLLHEKINTILPIEGIANNEDGTYRIDYISEPDQNQLNEINSIIQQWPLENAKLSKIKELDNEWRKTLETGWTTPYGWKLGLTTNDLVLLNGNFTLAKEAQINNINMPVFVIDTNNEPHELSTPDLTILMLQYGQARSNLSSQYASKIKLIKEASSIDSLNNIDITIQ